METYGDHAHAADVDYVVEIDTAGDETTATFKWSADGVEMGTLIPVSAVSRTHLQYGVFVLFSQGTYHLADTWAWSAIGTANQLYDLGVDTTNSIVKVGNRLEIGNDPNFAALLISGLPSIKWGSGAGLYQCMYYNRSPKYFGFFPDSGGDAELHIGNDLDDHTRLLLANMSLDFIGEADAALPIDADARLAKDGSDRLVWRIPTGLYTLAFTSELHNVLTIGADGMHSLSTQVLSGVAATASQAGHATTAQITKLDGIEAAADVTDAANVTAAIASVVPGGELGGTWGNPTVDATHSGSAHHALVTLGAGSDSSLTLSGQELTLTVAGINPISSADIWDDFVGGNLTSGSLGSLGWTITLANTATVTQTAAEAGHPGIVTLSTGATIISPAIIMLPATEARAVLGSDLWNVTFIVKTGASVAGAGTVLTVGFSSAVTDVYGASDHAAFVRFLVGTDTYWSLVTNDGGVTATATASDVAPQANTWYKFKLVRGASTVTLFIDGAHQVTHASDQDLPTGTMNPFARVTNAANAADKTFLVDFFSMTIPGLTR
jgi:hypothetical protein